MAISEMANYTVNLTGAQFKKYPRSSAQGLPMGSTGKMNLFTAINESEDETDIYYRTLNFAYCKHAKVTGQRSVVGYYGK